MKIFALSLLLSVCTALVAAQPRPVTPSKTTAPAPTPETKDAAVTKPVATPTPAPPPPDNIKAKYEGGVFGYSKKQDGTLHFDEINNRILFRNKEGKEMLSFTYESLNIIYPDTKSVRPLAATIISSAVPYGLGLPALLFKKKVRYLTFEYKTEDGYSGRTGFKLENKETLVAVVTALCGKADLKPQGEACYRPKKETAATTTTAKP